MPLYDFKCENCERVEEMLLSSAGSFDTKLTCPECETETMKRLIGLSNFKLAGGGWAKDGYEKKTARQREVERSTGLSYSGSAHTSSPDGKK